MPFFLNTTFARDANNSLTVLDELNKKGPYREEDMRTYIIHVHGMKSALANIGAMDLSAVAMKLETSARDGNMEVVLSETSAFLDLLRSLVEELTSKEKINNCGKVDDDPVYLREKLCAVRAACEEYDEKAAATIIDELKTRKWSQKTAELLDAISEHLFISEFDEAADDINKFMG